jgi:hypothetical protein
MPPRLQVLLQCAAVGAITLFYLTRIGTSNASSHRADRERPAVVAPAAQEPLCCRYFGDEYEAAERALQSRPVEPQAPTF